MAATSSDPQRQPGKRGSQALFLPLAIAAGAGIVLWIGASFVSGKREAWDAGFYWTAAYPASIVLSGLMALVWPRGSWRWPLAIFLFQFVGMVVRNGELGGLWPLGLVLFAALAVPGILVARFVTWLRGKSKTD